MTHFLSSFIDLLLKVG
jgi:hypothetical protein